MLKWILFVVFMDPNGVHHANPPVLYENEIMCLAGKTIITEFILKDTKTNPNNILSFCEAFKYTIERDA